jgi:hypothetical protein
MPFRLNELQPNEISIDFAYGSNHDYNLKGNYRHFCYPNNGGIVPGQLFGLNGVVLECKDVELKDSPYAKGAEVGSLGGRTNLDIPCNVAADLTTFSESVLSLKEQRINIQCRLVTIQGDIIFQQNEIGSVKNDALYNRFFKVADKEKLFLMQTGPGLILIEGPLKLLKVLDAATVFRVGTLPFQVTEVKDTGPYRSLRATLLARAPMGLALIPEVVVSEQSLKELGEPEFMRAAKTISVSGENVGETVETAVTGSVQVYEESGFTRAEMDAILKRGGTPKFDKSTRSGDTKVKLTALAVPVNPMLTAERLITLDDDE